MQIKAEYSGDNPVKVTGSMKGKLNVFSKRQTNIIDITKKIEEANTALAQNNAKQDELRTVANGEDKKAAKKANSELKKMEKEAQSLSDELNKENEQLAALRASEQKVIANLLGVNFIKGEETTTVVEPVVQNADSVAENNASVAEVNPQNSLSDELSDFSFEMPETTTVEPTTAVEDTSAPVVEPVAEQASTPAIEAVVEEPVVEQTPVTEPAAEATPMVEEVPTDIPVAEANPVVEPVVEETPAEPVAETELPQVNVTEIEPNIDNEPITVENASDEQEPLVDEEPATMTSTIPVTPDYNFDEPVIPASDEEIESALASTDDETGGEVKNEEKEEITVTPEDKAAIDSVINGEYKMDDIFGEPENKEEKADHDIFAQMPSVESTVMAEENVEVKPKEYGLKDYFAFESYQKWLFALAKEIYGKDSFTLEELNDLKDKEGYISDEEYDRLKASQVDSLINDKETLERENAKLTVQLNASKTFGDRVSNELSEVKGSYKDLQRKYDNQTEQLHDTENNLRDTETALRETQEELAARKEEVEKNRVKYEKEMEENRAKHEEEMAKVQSEFEEIQDTLQKKNRKLDDYKELFRKTAAILGDMQDDERVNSEEEDKENENIQVIPGKSKRKKAA